MKLQTLMPLLLLLSCQSEELSTHQADGEDGDKTVILGQISSIYSSVQREESLLEERYDFAYDSLGQIHNMSYSEESTSLDSLGSCSAYHVTFSYDYLGDSILLSQRGEYIIDGVEVSSTGADKSLYINYMGYIESRLSSSINGGDTYSEEHRFSYDDSGYLVNYAMLYSREIDGQIEYGSASGRDEYTYREGNLRYVSYHNMEDVGYIERDIEYSDYTNALNLNLDYLLGIADYSHDTVIPARGLYGRSSAMLPSGLTYIKSGVQYDYLYTFDSGCYLTKVEILLDGESQRIYYIEYN